MLTTLRRWSVSRAAPCSSRLLPGACMAPPNAQAPRARARSVAELPESSDVRCMVSGVRGDPRQAHAGCCEHCLSRVSERHHRQTHTCGMENNLHTAARLSSTRAVCQKYAPVWQRRLQNAPLRQIHVAPHLKPGLTARRRGRKPPSPCTAIPMMKWPTIGSFSHLASVRHVRSACRARRLLQLPVGHQLRRAAASLASYAAA